MKHGLMFSASLVAATIAAAAVPRAQQDLTARARAIHERVITLDTHNDIDPGNFTRGCNYTMRADDAGEPAEDEGGRPRRLVHDRLRRPVDPPQVAERSTPAGYDRAYKAAVAKFDAVHHLTEEIAPNEIELALTAADVTRIAKSGKKVAVIGIENGYPDRHRYQRVKEFWQRGGRYMSLAHNGHSQLADSNTGEADNKWTWGGLSPLGRQVIAGNEPAGASWSTSRIRRRASMMQAIGLSKAPVIASHSAVRKLANHSRNLDDEMLMAMKTNGGVVQIGGVAELRQGRSRRNAGRRLRRCAQEFALPAGRGGGAGTRRRRGGARRAAVPGGSALGGTGAGRGRGGRGGATAGLETLTPPIGARSSSGGWREIDRQVARCRPRHRQGLRRSHRLRGEADRHRPRRHLVGLRRRRRHRRLEQRGRDAST